MDRHLGRTIALTIVGILVAASLVGGGWWLAQRGGDAPAASGAPAATTPATVAPTIPPATPATPPDAKAAVATAVSFMRRKVGMADLVAGPFRWTGTGSGQVEVRARIPGDANPARGPVSTVSLQRLSKVWYVLGVRSDAIGVVVPQPQDAIRSPLGIIAVANNDRVRVRVTQDRYGPDLELGSAYLSPEPAPKLAGTIAFAHPSATTGSVVLTTASGRNGEVWAATVVRLRLATGQPPQILGIRLSPQLPQQDGVLQLPAEPGTLTIHVTASHADRARLVYTPTGTETAWYAKVVSQDTTAGDGLRLVWHYSQFDALGNVMVVVVGPGGVATHDRWR